MSSSSSGAAADDVGSDVNSYARLLSHASVYKSLFIVSFFGFLLYAMAQTLFLECINLFVSSIQAKSENQVSAVGTHWWSGFLPDHLENSAYLLPSLIIVLSLLRGMGYYFGNYFISRAGLNVVNDLRKKIFQQLMYMPQSFHDKSHSGEQISLIIYNVEQVAGSVTRAVKTLLEDGLFLIGLLVYLLFTNWLLTLVFLAIIPIIAGLVFIASRYFRRVSTKIQQSVGRVTHITKESVQGIQTVKSYKAEDFETELFRQAADENLKYSTKFARVESMQTPIMHFVIAIATAVVFFLVVALWSGDQASNAVAFVVAALLTAKPVKQLSSINAIIQRGLAAADTIFSVIDHEEERDDGQIDLNHQENTIRGSIYFDDISFSYKEADKVIKHLDLHIDPGETVALVGPSGSGKSTIASLLLRFYQASSGRLLIDGHNINDIRLGSLRENIALVSQSPVLFDSTIQDNVCYGAKNVDKEKLESALKNANAWDFVSALTNGVHTSVGEGGSQLSGGQRQRIAIARALYKDAPILILDEATSALDNKSEKQIQSALEKLKQGRTTLLIAHRLSTIIDADNIVVLKKGRIIEMGTHQQLIRLNKAYADLYNSQSSNSDTASMPNY